MFTHTDKSLRYVYISRNATQNPNLSFLFEEIISITDIL